MKQNLIFLILISFFVGLSFSESTFAKKHHQPFVVNFEKALKQIAHAHTDSFKERQKALNKLQKDYIQPKYKVAALLLEARLFGIVFSHRSRRHALKKALKISSKTGLKNVKMIKTMLEADKELLYLSKMRSRREVSRKKIRLQKGKVILADAHKIYIKFGHIEQAYRVTLALLRYGYLSDAARKIRPSWKEFEKNLMRLSKKNRHMLPILKNYYLLQSKIAKSAKDYAEAFKWHAKSDLLYIVSPRKTQSKELMVHLLRNPYRMSKASEHLCFKALSVTDLAYGRDCSSLMEDSNSKPLYFNYSKLSVTPEFDQGYAARTLGMYKVLLLNCIKSAANSAEVLNERLRLEWSVQNNGHVGLIEIRPLWLKKTKLKVCLEESLKIFRYRPYHGEVQSVLLEFEIGE